MACSAQDAGSEWAGGGAASRIASDSSPHWRGGGGSDGIQFRDAVQHGFILLCVEEGERGCAQSRCSPARRSRRQQPCFRAPAAEETREGWGATLGQAASLMHLLQLIAQPRALAANWNYPVGTWTPPFRAVAASSNYRKGYRLSGEDRVSRHVLLDAQLWWPQAQSVE